MADFALSDLILCWFSNFLHSSSLFWIVRQHLLSVCPWWPREHFSWSFFLICWLTCLWTSRVLNLCLMMNPKAVWLPCLEGCRFDQEWEIRNWLEMFVRASWNQKVRIWGGGLLWKDWRYKDQVYFVDFLWFQYGYLWTWVGDPWDPIPMIGEMKLTQRRG